MYKFHYNHNIVSFNENKNVNNLIVLEIRIFTENVTVHVQVDSVQSQLIIPENFI